MDIPYTDQPWLSFKQPLVQELAFSIASPPLLADWPVSLASGPKKGLLPAQGLTPELKLPDHHFWQLQFANYLPRLLQLDTNPLPLEQHMLSLRSTRLGIRFEHLLAFWLQDNAYHPFTLLGQGIKRMDGQRTIGEIDFLIFNQDTRQTEHWEVAIKFYLGEGNLQAEHWLGPNRRDSLDRKLKHLYRHQFDVMHAKQHTIDLRRAIVKGRLFYPAGAAMCFPSWTAPQHLTGFWGEIVPVAPPGFTWRYASRQEWMVAKPDGLTTKPLSGHSIIQNPVYWRSGLYLLLDAENKVILHYMLRITDKMHKSLNNDNTLKPNPNAADIFNQISII